LALIIDTRFLIAHTFPPSIEDKKRIERFTARILKEKLLVPNIVVVEYIKIAGRRIGKEAAKTRLNLWRNIGVEIVSLTEELSFKAGELALKHPQIPLADTMIATIASKHNARIVTDDHHYNILGAKTLWYK